MKGMKRIFSTVVALIIMVGSVPLTVNASSAPTGGFATADSWTRNSDSVGKLNAYLNYTRYNFMQTRDNQSFTFTPELFLQKNGGAAYAYFNSFTLFTGEHYTGDEKVEEYPEISDENPNTTSSFIDEYGASFAWRAVNANAEKTGFPDSGFGISGSFVDIAGCPRYYWNCDIGFNGNGADVYGEINTGFYWNLDWTYAYNSSSEMTNRQARIGVKVNVTDVRPLIAVVARANAVVAAGVTADNSQDYLDLIATAVSNVPSAMLNGTEYFSQAEVDEQLRRVDAAVSGIADYTEYNETYASLCAVTNSDGKYTANSFEAFKNEIASIDENLSRGLKISEQSVVDAAVASLNSAFSGKLVANNLGTSGSDTISSAYKNSPVITLSPLDFKFMQTYDDEIFAVSTELYATLKDFSYSAYFRDIVFDTSASAEECGSGSDDVCDFRNGVTENKTADFLSRAVTGVLTADGVSRPNGWVFNSEKSSSSASSLVEADGTIRDNRINMDVFSSLDYYANNTLTFKGNDAVTDGVISTNFFWKISWKYQQLTASDSLRHAHLPVTVTVTDVRPLIEKYKEIERFLNSLDESEVLYSGSSVTALRTAFAAVPASMLNGTSFFEQASVDSMLSALTNAFSGVELLADYSEYERNMADAANIISSNNADGSYSAAAFVTFHDTIQTIADGIDSDLGASSQSRIDAASAAIRDALNLLSENGFCDYSGLDAAIALCNNLGDASHYTSSSLSAVETALQNARAVSRNLVMGVDGVNQRLIDDTAAALSAAFNELIQRTDYTLYNSEMAKAAAIISSNNSGNSYDAADFERFKDAVTALDSQLDKDLPDGELNRKTVADAADALKNELSALTAVRYYFIKCYDDNGTLLDTLRTQSVKLGALSLPAMPADTETTAYCGWRTALETILTPSYTVCEDISIYIASEAKVLLPKAESGLSIDNGSGIISGVAANSTVEHILSSLINDETLVEIRDFAGTLLSASDKVGTGATVTVRSKYTYNKIYSTDTVLVMGDVNGDGTVDAEDFNISTAVSLGTRDYTSEETVFKTANDIDGDGVIDVIDTFNIQRMY